MSARNCRSVLVGALFIVGLAGCPGSDDIGSTVPVSGKVTIDGKPLESGTVTYHAEESKGNKTKAGVTGIVKNGEYTLNTGSVTSNRSGAPPGWYKVTISTAPQMMGQATAAPTDPKGFDPKTALPSSKGAPIAQKYTDVKETPLEVKVESGNNAAYNLEATSK